MTIYYSLFIIIIYYHYLLLLFIIIINYYYLLLLSIIIIHYYYLGTAATQLAYVKLATVPRDDIMGRFQRQQPTQLACVKLATVPMPPKRLSMKVTLIAARTLP